LTIKGKLGEASVSLVDGSSARDLSNAVNRTSDSTGVATTARTSVRLQQDASGGFTNTDTCHANTRIAPLENGRCRPQTRFHPLPYPERLANRGPCTRTNGAFLYRPG
jgi:hypothetical protein